MQDKLASLKMKINEKCEKIIDIEIDHIIPDKEQPRINFSNLDQLIQSIKTNGQLLPIIVMPSEHGEYKLVDGERRYRAIKQIAEDNNEDLSKVKIKAICLGKDTDPNTGLIINLIRENYSPFEVANALHKIKKSDASLTNTQIGEMIGKSRQNVGEYLSLLKLPEAIRQQEIQQNIVPFNQLKQIAAKSDISDDEKIKKYQKLVKEYSTDKDNEDEAPKQNNAKDKPARDEEEIITKKFSAMTRKLDSTLTALGKFHVERITNVNDRQTLADKLEQIIVDAQKMKEKLKNVEK